MKIYEQEISIPGKVYQMAMASNQQYLYFVSNQLTVFDLLTKKIIQRIPHTKYAWITLSKTGSKLCLIQPTNQNKTQLIVYEATPLLHELVNIIFDDTFKESFPLFTDDEHFIVFSTQKKLYKVSIHLSKYSVLLSLNNHCHYISSYDVNDTYIICSVHSSSNNFEEVGIYIWGTNDSFAKYISFSNPEKIFHVLFKAKLSNDNKIILYFSLAHFTTGIQYISDLSIECLFLTLNTHLLPLAISHISVSDDRTYSAFVGSTLLNGCYQKTVHVYKMSDMSLVYQKEFSPFLWNAQFCRGKNRLLISGQKQYFIDI